MGVTKIRGGALHTHHPFNYIVGYVQTESEWKNEETTFPSESGPSAVRGQSDNPHIFDRFLSGNDDDNFVSSVSWNS